MPFLTDLLPQEEILTAHGPLDVPIERIATDSREVAAGDLFICLPGYQTEGGRSAQIGTTSSRLHWNAAQRQLRSTEISGRSRSNGRSCPRLLGSTAAAACRFHRHPSRDLLVVGVQGRAADFDNLFRAVDLGSCGSLRSANRHGRIPSGRLRATSHPNNPGSARPPVIASRGSRQRLHGSSAGSFLTPSPCGAPTVSPLTSAFSPTWATITSTSTRISTTMLARRRGYSSCSPTVASRPRASSTSTIQQANECSRRTVPSC